MPELLNLRKVIYQHSLIHSFIQQTLLSPRLAGDRYNGEQKSTHCLPLPTWSLCVSVLSHFSRVQFFGPYRLQPARLLCPWDSPGKNTRMGCYALLQGLCPTQGLNPCLFCLLNWQAGSLSPEPPNLFIYSWLCCMALWDLSSLTRDGTHDPCIGSAGSELLGHHGADSLIKYSNG